MYAALHDVFRDPAGFTTQDLRGALGGSAAQGSVRGLLVAAAGGRPRDQDRQDQGGQRRQNAGLAFAHRTILAGLGLRPVPTAVRP